MTAPCNGVWVAYYSDQSAAVIFWSEIDALRYAVDHSMYAAFWTFGVTLSDVIEGRSITPKDKR